MRWLDLKRVLGFFRRRRLLVIPAVNCTDLQCLRDRFEKLRSYGCKEAHLDVSDGAFAPTKLMTEVAAPDIVKNYSKDIFIEAHLMTVRPLLEVERWVSAGVRRLLFHVETMDARQFTDAFFALKKKYPKLEIGVSVLPETDAEEAVPYVGVCGFAQCLAVSPGPSGQTFIPGAIEKVEYIRRDLPASAIELDGGVTPEIARRAREAGADIVISGSYLWGAPDFLHAYEELKNS